VGEWSASRPGRAFTPGERTPGTHWTGGWVGLRAGLDTEATGKILCLCRGSNPDRLVVQSVVRQYAAWANQARKALCYFTTEQLHFVPKLVIYITQQRNARSPVKGVTCWSTASLSISHNSPGLWLWVPVGLLSWGVREVCPTDAWSFLVTSVSSRRLECLELRIISLSTSSRGRLNSELLICDFPITTARIVGPIFFEKLLFKGRIETFDQILW
jgi:hypothetical protein